ncbi:MAG TPA: fasciclin domain-containing protein [Caulobacter sp.]|nr:fasciclin domain-containing protein [Caulobacter sp.]
MIRNTLFTAVAATALMAAPAAFAQTAPEAAAPAAPAAQTPAATGNVIDVLKERGQFTTLLQALDQAQLTETLATRPAITIFAPTDEAFAALPEAERTRLLDPANAQELRNLMLYHVLVTEVRTDQIKGARGPISTAGGVDITLDGTGDAIMVGGATVTQAEIDASNGGVFVLDKVLNPEAAAQGDAEDAATTAPATGVNAPNGQPAAAVTTTASPPVQNPTDGQVDQTEDPANPAPTPN